MIPREHWFGLVGKGWANSDSVRRPSQREKVKTLSLKASTYSAGRDWNQWFEAAIIPPTEVAEAAGTQYSAIVGMKRMDDVVEAAAVAGAAVFQTGWVAGAVERVGVVGKVATGGKQSAEA